MTAEHAWVLVERTTLKIMPRGFDAAHRPPIPIPCGCHSEAPECRSSSSSFGRITYSSIGELARQINSIVRGWMQYYGAFYRTALHPLLERVNGYLMRWLRKKYRRLRAFLKAKACWRRITRQYPRLFAQWAWSVSF